MNQSARSTTTPHTMRGRERPDSLTSVLAPRMARTNRNGTTGTRNRSV